MAKVVTVNEVNVLCVVEYNFEKWKVSKKFASVILFPLNNKQIKVLKF